MKNKKMYPMRFAAPAIITFIIFFLVPLILSFYYSMTIWNLDSTEFCGFLNYKTFFTEKSTRTSLPKTLIYAFLSCGLKTFFAFWLAVLLTSGIKTKNYLRSVVFFPVLVSTVAVGLTFKALMHPTKGLYNVVLESIGINGIDWLGNTDIALFSIIAVEVWKGVGVATVIFIAGMSSIDQSYYDAAAIDGASGFNKIRYITFPLCRSSMNSVIILALTGGLRTFDLIYSMSGGGPGYATETMALSVYKQYSNGFYGLSTAGNVVMLVLIAAIAYPLERYLRSREEVM